MNILFILSGNTQWNVNHRKNENVLIKNAKYQGDQLIKMNYSLDYFFIKGKGVLGYLKNIPLIIKFVKKGNYDIIHAHYSYTAIAASFIGNKKLVVSLMGSDTHVKAFLLLALRMLCKYYWKVVIVKSEGMKSRLNIGNIIVLPNGVDLEVFRPMDKLEARKHLNLPEGKIILFAADPSRPEKNFKLAQEAFSILNDSSSILLPIYNVNHNEMPFYMNASNVLLLTSLWEGSANVVKEAMACNLIVVSTDVGDVKMNTKDLPGYYITSHDASEIAKALQLALDQNDIVNGVERIKDLELDAVSVNKRLIDIYESLIKK